VSTTAAAHRGADGLLPARLERSLLWRIKLRLQFTGWLQFIPNAMAALLCLLIAGAAWLLAGASAAAWLPLALGLALLAVLAFDIGTVKFGLLPAGAVPAPRGDLDPFDLMRARRSCRSFQRRDLTPEHRAELLRAARQYSQRDQRLGDKPIRIEYVAAPLTVWPAMGARAFLIAVAPVAYDRLSVIDVGRSLQKVVLHATRMGLATCWIGPGADQQSAIAHLGDRFDPREDHVICVCAVGYRSRFMPLTIRLMQIMQHRRLPLAALFFSDPYFNAPLDVTAPPFAAYGRCYEVCQWSPSSYNSQTTRCAAVTGTIDGRPKPARFDFCAATNSRYYAAVALGIWCANWETGCQALGLHGHFAVLSPGQRGVPDAPALPRYDVSWLVAPQDRDGRAAFGPATSSAKTPR
jgi:nitroreductase